LPYKQNLLNDKVNTARLSVISNSALIIIKLIAGFATGSISIISEAIHSSMDLVASVMAFYSVKVSSNPPDKQHPYGHGKIENISGVIEALLILIASIWIVYESTKKFSHLTLGHSLPAGIAVMLISALVNIIISRKLYKVAKATDSVALEADALHLRADVWTSLGVGISLFIVWLTGLAILDPIIAILVAIVILWEAFTLLRSAFSPLLDTKLPDEEIDIIQNAIKAASPEKVKFHQLRTRKSGFRKFIDLHLEVPEELSVKESHEICDRIEKEIEQKIAGSEVVIHVEPLPE
jgi:cation diffusion facilitator family transporter